MVRHTQQMDGRIPLSGLLFHHFLGYYVQFILYSVGPSRHWAFFASFTIVAFLVMIPSRVLGIICWRKILTQGWRIGVRHIYCLLLKTN